MSSLFTGLRLPQFQPRKIHPVVIWLSGLIFLVIFTRLILKWNCFPLQRKWERSWEVKLNPTSTLPPWSLKRLFQTKNKETPQKLTITGKSLETKLNNRATTSVKSFPKLRLFPKRGLETGSIPELLSNLGRVHQRVRWGKLFRGGEGRRGECCRNLSDKPTSSSPGLNLLTHYWVNRGSREWTIERVILHRAPKCLPGDTVATNRDTRVLIDKLEAA